MSSVDVNTSEVIKTVKDNLDKLELLHTKIAYEALNSENDYDFKYLLILQTIVLKLIHVNKFVLERFEDDEEGKINYKKLHELLTELIDTVRLPRNKPFLESPALGGK